MSDGLVVLVEFRLHPGKAATFAPLIMRNAAQSVADEPGCRRFDVTTPEAGKDPELFVLYEIYDDHAAFEAHLAMPHYLSFKAATDPLIAERSIRFLDLAEHAKPAGAGR